MIQAFLDLSTAAQFSVLALAYCGTAGLIHGVMMVWPTKKAFAHLRGVIGTFIGAVGLLFGLLTGFLANEVSGRYRTAWETVTTEANSLIALHTLSIAAPSDLAGIRDALRNFARSELTDEWPRLIAHEGAAPATDLAFRALLERVSAGSVGSGAGSAVQGQLLAAALRAGDARSRRLALVADNSDDLQWVCVLVLALLTQFSIALVHLERRAPQAAALAVFTAAAIVALSLIALQEEPFSGPLRIEPTQLEGVLKFIGTT